MHSSADRVTTVSVELHPFPHPGVQGRSGLSSLHMCIEASTAGRPCPLSGARDVFPARNRPLKNSDRFGGLLGFWAVNNVDHVFGNSHARRCCGRWRVADRCNTPHLIDAEIVAKSAVTVQRLRADPGAAADHVART